MIGIIGIALGIILVFPLLSSTIEPGCENCGCCKDGVCGSGFVEGRNITKDYCIHGCIPGYGGNKCYVKCPKNCLKCNQSRPRMCESCADGRFLVSIIHTTYTTYTRECLSCSSKCKKCTSLTKCQECIFPYFTDDITTDCSLTCLRNCLCESVGVCSSCKQGYYNTTNQCRDACPDTCSTCTDETYCQSCKPSYSGDKCCIKDGYCEKCFSSTVCDICDIGYYGEICNKPCPERCPKMSQEMQCKRDDGACLSCDVGLYGNYCTMKCSEWCLNHQCHKDTGYCTDGCVVGFEGSNCAEKICVEKEADTENDNGKVIGLSAAVFTAILIIMIIVNIFAVRRWKVNYQRMNLENRIIYVNTQSQPSPTDKDDDHSDIKGHFQYETLQERNVTHHDEYDQIKYVT